MLIGVNGATLEAWLPVVVWCSRTLQQWVVATPRAKERDRVPCQQRKAACPQVHNTLLAFGDSPLLLTYVYFTVLLLLLLLYIHTSNTTRITTLYVGPLMRLRLRIGFSREPSVAHQGTERYVFRSTPVLRRLLCCAKYNLYLYY